MSIHRFSAGILAAALVAGLPAGSWADDQADFEKAMTAAREVRKQAAVVGGEWRDIGKFLEQAEQSAAKGDFATANQLADKARRQGELGYEQAMSQKDVGLPAYMIAGSGKGATETSDKNRDVGQKVRDPALTDPVEIWHEGK